MHITIIIHMFNTDLYEEMKGYVQQVEKVYPNTRTIFTVPLQFTPPDKKYIFIPIENKGVNVYGFMMAIEFMRKYKLKTDWILKIHSKISNFVTQEKVNYNWRTPLVHPLVHPEFLPNLKIFNKQVGYIGSSIHHLHPSYDDDFPQNKKGIDCLITQFPTIPSSSAGFIGGNIFWIHRSVVDQHITPAFIQYCKPLFSLEKPPKESTCPIIEYIIERIVPGNMCWGLHYILVHQDGTFTIKRTK
jgi:hypothetical protein